VLFRKQISLFGLWCLIASTGIGFACADDHPQYGRKVEATARAETLELLAREMRASYAKLKTWRGTYAITELIRRAGDGQFMPGNRRPEEQWTDAELPDSLMAKLPLEKNSEGIHWTLTTAIAMFNIDNTAGKFRGEFDSSEPPVYIDLPTNTRVRSIIRTGPVRYWIFTPDAAIQFDTQRREGQLQGFPEIQSLPLGRVVHRKALKAATRGNVFFYPRGFLTHVTYRQHENRTYADYCERAAGYLRGDGKTRDIWDKATSIYVNDELPPIYTEIFHTSDGSEDIRRYDGKVGFHVVLFSQKIKGELFSHIVTTFRNETGIPIPETREWTLNQESPQGLMKPFSVRSETLVKSETNVDIPESDFSMDRFQLKYGDRLADEIEKRLFVHDGVTGFVPAEGFVFDPARAKSESRH
jgi:hypothetical protein